MLQTWTRDLRYHPRVHLLVPSGGLTADQLRWPRKRIAVEPPSSPNGNPPSRVQGSTVLRGWLRVKDWGFLVPQVKLAARFKGRLQAEQPALFQAVPAKVWWIKWVADVQAVTFRYRANGGTHQRCTVSGQEFVRRFRQHKLPKGFQRVRHSGWRGAAAQAKWARILALLDWQRCAANPIVRVRPGGYDESFCFDGKVFRDGDHWVMFYFGVGQGGAHIMAAFSRDLRHWASHPEPLCLVHHDEPRNKLIEVSAQPAQMIRSSRDCDPVDEPLQRGHSLRSRYCRTLRLPARPCPQGRASGDHGVFGAVAVSLRSALAVYGITFQFRGAAETQSC